MEEEITLRELIEVLLSGKHIIAGITIIAILISGIFSFFVVSPTYEAKTTLMVSPMVNSSASREGESTYDALLSNLFQYPQMTLETYRVQVTDPHLLNQVIQELSLDTEKYSINSMQNSINVEAIKDTNLIQISVKDKDPALAAKIANTLAPKFVEFLSAKIQQQMGKSAEFIKEQLETEKKNLDAATQELKEFMEKPQSVNELQQDIEAKLALITGFKTQLVQLDVEEKATRAALEKAKEQLAKEPEILELEKSLFDDPTMSAMANTGDMKDAANIKIKSQEVNLSRVVLNDKVSELEVSLAGISSRRSAIAASIQQTQAELEKLQAQLAEKQTEFNRLQQQYTTAQETYNSLYKKYQESRLTTSDRLGDSNIMVVSPAIEPTAPVAPKKMLNVAIAAVLGLMVGVFVVFFMDYWEKSGQSQAMVS